MSAADRTRPVGIDTSLVECIVVAVPEAESVPGVAAALADLAEGAAIRILDVVAVTRSRASGGIMVAELEDLDDATRALVDDRIGELLSENDIALASAALLPGSTGIVVVVEDRWAESLSSAARSAGGQVLGGRRIPRTSMEAALVQPPLTPASDGVSEATERRYLRRSKPGLEPAAADELAAQLLGDAQTRLGGLQIAHARRVADKFRGRGDDRLIAVALLHDVVEKGRTTLAGLLAVSNDADVVALVDVLTCREGETDEQYLSRCAADPAALAVKRADLEDKQFRADVRVPPSTAQQLREQAELRLAMLDDFARSAGSPLLDG